MVEKTGKSCGCGCGSTLLGLLLIGLLAIGVIGSQALALGDQPLTNPTEAAATGMTWNQILEDRERAKKENPNWDTTCDLGSAVGLLFGVPAYIVYPIAGNDPAGRKGFFGVMIDPSDWNRGIVPVNTPFHEGVFRTYQAFYWYNMVTGASSTHGLGGGCKLRPLKRIRSGIEG